MADPFAALAAPPSTFTAVTPADDGTLVDVRGLYIGGAGNVYVDGLNGGTNVALIGLPAGTILPGRISRVYATNTTATNIVALG